MTVTAPAPAVGGCEMTAEVRSAFERDGFLVVPGVLGPAEIAHHTALVDGLYSQRARAGRLGRDGALHELSAIRRCAGLAPLVDNPRVLGLVCDLLGWNVHVYHSHIDVHPKVTDATPFRYEWHQDGGRQNHEIETNPRPRLSVKVGYWLSDITLPGRGNLKLVPGSHTVNRIDGPPRREQPWPDPPGAVEVLAEPGDAVMFDRRIWHARSRNTSSITRKAVFFAYTYRWVQPRDEAPAPSRRFNSVQRQLLGLLGRVGGDHAWGHDPTAAPLYQELRRSEQSRGGGSAPHSLGFASSSAPRRPPKHPVTLGT